MIRKRCVRTLRSIFTMARLCLRPVVHAVVALIFQQHLHPTHPLCPHLFRHHRCQHCPRLPAKFLPLNPVSSRPHFQLLNSVHHQQLQHHHPVRAFRQKVDTMVIRVVQTLMMQVVLSFLAAKRRMKLPFAKLTRWVLMLHFFFSHFIFQSM